MSTKSDTGCLAAAGEAVRRRRCMRLACAVAVMLLACAAPLAMTGCRSSDALKEIIYDQTSTLVDYDNPDKYKISDSTSEKKDDSVPSKESSKKGKLTDRKQNIVVYSSKPNASQYKAKKAVWDPDPDFQGIEASESVSFYESDSPDATEQDIAKTEEPEENEDSETVVTASADTGKNSDTGTGGSGNSDEKGKKKSPTAKKKTTTPQKNGGGQADESEEKEEEKKQEEEEDDSVPKVEDSSGKLKDPPKVSRIATYGQLAVIVQMVGGKKALAAADSELLNSEFADVFSDEGAKDIAVGWSDDGSAENIDADAIIDSGADAIVVDSADYVEDIPKAQRKKLNKQIKAGKLQIVQLGALVNSANIKSDVAKVGSMLSESKDIGEKGQTEQIAQEYETFHDELVGECSDANGGLAYDTNNEDEKVYEVNGSTKGLTFSSDAKFTLLLDAWDPSVKWSNEDTWSPSGKGIALSRIGYDGTPVSFYIQAGGLINNAAARGNVNNPGLYPVWQFASLALVKKNFTYESGGAFDESCAPAKRRESGTAWSSILLTTDRHMSSGSSSTGDSFGTTEFPTLIAATREIKEEFIEASEDDDSIYHANDPLEDDVRGPCGPVVESGELVLSCIGTTGSDSSVETTVQGAIDDDAVVVNPHGLFSSWTQGGSVESVLEAAWVNDVVNEESDAVGWQDKVVEFYQTFYRYDATDDLDVIEKGAAE